MMEIRVIKYDTLPSTNFEARSQAENGAQEGLCIVAEDQTAGYGRHGNAWTSARLGGLYLSIVLRPSFPKAFWGLINLAAALATAKVLRDLYSITSDIKWPNDILVGEKKISGILSETVTGASEQAVILGLGINRKSDHLTGELADSTTSIQGVCGNEGDYEELIEATVREVGRHYERLTDHGSRMRLLEEWCESSSYASGKRVRALVNKRRIEGTTDGLDEHGGLWIKTSDGPVLVNAGEVRSLRS